MSAPSLPAYTRLKWEIEPGKMGAWIAESDLGTAPAIREALRQAVDADFLTYLPTATALAAERACARFLGRRYDWHLEDTRVHLIPDVLAGLRITIDRFTAPGSAVVVPTPAYMPFLSVPLECGREVIQVPCHRNGGRWQVDLDAVDRAFSEGAGLLVLCNPHNPLGQSLSPSEMSDIAAIVERWSGTVFSDEIHAPLVYPGGRHRPFAASGPRTAEYTVTATSTSKGWNIPGLKAAQLILTGEAHQAQWVERPSVRSQDGSILGAVAAKVAYDGGETWLTEITAAFDRNRWLLAELLAEHAPGVAYTPPEATYLAWLDFSALDLTESPARILEREAGIVVTDGAACGAGFEDFVRLNFATTPPVLSEIVQRMGAALRGR